LKTNKAPGHLSKDAKALWQELTNEYAINDSGGLAILKTGLEAWDRAASARMQIDKEGMVLADKYEQKKAHPLLTVEKDNRAAFLNAIKMLNLDIEPLRDKAGRPGGK
jgi:P27 family predicted phage terminase small subunit